MERIGADPEEKMRAPAGTWYINIDEQVVGVFNKLICEILLGSMFIHYAILENSLGMRDMCQIIIMDSQVTGHFGLHKGQSSRSMQVTTSLPASFFRPQPFLFSANSRIGLQITAAWSLWFSRVVKSTMH